MNLVLFENAAEAALLAKDDLRAIHIRKVLRMSPGSKLYVGLVNGPRGMATVAEDGPKGLQLDIAWEKLTEPPRPFYVLAGLPRPQTARDLLREGAAFGLTSIDFFTAEKGEPSYAESTLWHSDEWSRRLREGAAQAFATCIPRVERHASLAACLEKFSSPANAVRIALDVYESTAPLSTLAPADGPVVVAIGAERGWSPNERVQLRAAGFALAGLGARVLREETALIAALSVVLAKRGEF